LGKLTTKLDSKHSKDGQEVIVEVTKDVKSGEQLLLAKGSLITGTISKVQSYAKGSSSAEFDIIFEKVIPKSGQQYPTHFALYALSAKLESQPADMLGSKGKQGVAMSAGISGDVKAPHDTSMTPQSTGIFGFQDVVLRPLVSMSPPTCQLSSPSGNMVMEKGTEVVLESLGQ